MALEFKKGDIVRCINNDTNGKGYLTVGKLYKIDELGIEPTKLFLYSDDRGPIKKQTTWYRERFEPVENPTKFMKAMYGIEV